MFKKIFLSTVAVVFLGGIFLASFDCLLWRFFGFNYCRTPKSLYVSTLEVEDNRCYISVEDMATGSFSATKYNGLIFKYSDGVLKIGVHKGIIGAKEKLSKEIVVDSQITEVIICGNGSEQVLFKR
ncbi:MAG: hypothetical protein IJA68_00070 [Clostridia bacterium]|nr:hypothetical protein [Clostridia bacterium]